MDMFVRHCEGNYGTSNIAYHKVYCILLLIFDAVSEAAAAVER